jgi:hypothetical protein
MKNGRTRMADKAEFALGVDDETGELSPGEFHQE